MAKMVQVFVVLRCYSCETFQVHQVKKTNKWVCKVCNEKQSVTKVYGKGKAADCRKHVQTLNMMRGEREKESVVAMAMQENHPPEDYATTFQTSDQHQQDEPMVHPVVVSGRESKWTSYVHPIDSEDDSDTEPDCTYTTEVGLYQQAHKRSAQEKRRPPDRTQPLSQSATLPSRGAARARAHGVAVGRSHETISPYSVISRNAESALHMDTPTPSVKAAMSCYELSPAESYLRLEGEAFMYEDQQQISQSMYDLSANHRDSLAKIRRDIRQHSVDQLPGSPRASQLPCNPRPSSRWAKYVSETNSDDEDATQLRHVFTSRSAQSYSLQKHN